MIQSGRLTQSVEIHAELGDKDRFRQTENTWAKIANGDARAEVTLVTGDERESRGGQVAARRYQVRMYYHPELNEEKRLVWRRKTGDKQLDIINIDNVNEEDRELIVLTEEAPRKGVKSR